MRRFALLSCLLAACSSSASGPSTPPVATYAPPPRQVVDEGVLREVLDVDGVVPPKNPTRDVGTPPERNRVRVVRYRPAQNPAKAARAVLVLMPGFLGGAGSFDPLARALVRRFADDPDGAVEAWAIDRRSNYLEDTHGDDVAEARKDPTLARRYYFDGEAVEGKSFGGFVDPSELAYESEWGLPTTLGDLRNVIAKVPDPKARVVLVGHSLGATIAEAYAAWDFEGKRGFDELAGLVLVDGVAGSELAPPSAFSEKTYLDGDASNPMSSAGLTVIRKGQPYVALPFLGVAALEHAERLALAAHLAPTAPRIADDDVTNTAAILFGLKRDAIPKMTNRAALGFAFDDASCGISIAAVAAGAPSGGAVGPYPGLFGGSLVHPTDPNASYDWVSFDATTPPERVRLADLARSWFEGPGLNFGEWYFPTRLALDAGVVGSLAIAEGDWREKYGLRARHGASLDLPVLALAAQLTADAEVAGKEPTASRYGKLQAMLSAPIGAGRPLAGVARADERAFKLVVRPRFTHIDPLQAADIGEGKAWYDELVTFVRNSSPKGGVAVP